MKVLLACVVVVSGHKPWLGPKRHPCRNPWLGPRRHPCRYHKLQTHECASNPCKNGATCSCKNRLNRYTCTCAPGWQGTNCDQVIDKCTINPCLNGGTCKNLLNAYTCACAAGWQGTNCEQGSFCVAKVS